MQTTRRARPRRSLTVVAGLVGCALASYVGPAPGPAGASRPHAAPGTACGAVVARPAAPSGATAPVRVTAVAGGELASVSVCVGRSGPYRFVVDTGSPRSAVDGALAATLHLAARGPVTLGGSGCATRRRLVAVPALRVGPIAVAAQAMVVTSLTRWSGRGFDGVLGSDVWGRFGAVRLDLTHRTLSVASAEGPVPSGNAVVEGQAAAAPPAAVALSSTAYRVPLTVVLASGTTGAFVRASVAGHGPYAFAVDTGSPTSSLSSTVGFAIGLPDRGSAPAPGGIGCAGRVPRLASTTFTVLSSGTSASAGSWERTLALPATEVPGPRLGGPLRSGMVGSVGLDVLGAYGALVVDYVGATLSVGTG